MPEEREGFCTRMPRPKKTDSEREAMRERILDSALAILREEGPEAITSRAIARRMDLSHMSLFTYFEDQSAILRALGDREQAHWRAQQQDIEQRAQSGDIRQGVLELLHFNITFARENPNLYRLALITPEVMGEKPEQTRRRAQTTVNQMARLLKLGMGQGLFAERDPWLAAATVIQIVNMPYILYHTGRLADPVIREQLAQEALTAAMLYLAHPANIR
jgi:AcrR family transcriptional regulator